MMEERKYTPAPWSVSYGEGSHGSSFGGYWQIDAESDAVACNQFCMAGARNDSVSKANAHLIAAAPEMYEALKVTRGNVASLGPAGMLADVYSNYTEWLAVIDAALAKAEGN